MGALLDSPPARDALVGLGVWAVFRLLGTAFSLREVLVAAVLIGSLHLGESGVLQHGISGPYVAQFVANCSEYATTERCRCARAELQRTMPAGEFESLAFKFYVDRMPPPRLKQALGDCT